MNFGKRRGKKNEKRNIEVSKKFNFGNLKMDTTVRFIKPYRNPVYRRTGSRALAVILLTSEKETVYREMEK